MKIENFYHGKVLLITGCTGFLGTILVFQYVILGKVVLEKFIRSLPTVKKIYILVRPKSGISIRERVKREIFGSPCFDPCKKLYPNFNQLVDEKVHAVEGDIAEASLIFDNDIKRQIAQEINIIINNAASVDFNLRLDLAIDINYYGPQRILEFAKQCPNLECFTHVSTCYVADREGYIDERVYDQEWDPEARAQEILKMPKEYFKDHTTQLVKPWPNTYTYSKCMAERTLLKTRGNVPVLIVRPSIIIAAYQEPLPGWIDAVAAAVPLTSMICQGLNRYLVTKDYVRADIIPVDFVCNSIIIGTVYHSRKDALQICHSASSHVNPITWDRYVNLSLEYIKKQPFSQNFRDPYYKLLPNQQQFDRRVYIENILPGQIILKFATLTKNKKLYKDGQRFLKLSMRMIQINKLFHYFVSNDWCFENVFIYKVLNELDDQDRITFDCNPKNINLKQICYLNVYGMQKYLFREDVNAPFYEQSQLIIKHSFNRFEDISTILQKGQKINNINLEKIFDKVLYSNLVQSEIRNHFESYMKAYPGISRGDAYNKFLSEAKKYLYELKTEINSKYVTSVMYIFHKQFRNRYDQIMINDNEIKQLKNLIMKDKKPILLVPSFKSHVDLILLSYIHMMYEIDLPIFVGMNEFNNIPIVSSINKKCGGFFVDSNHLQKPLYRVVLEEYLSQILKKNYILGYHIERQRERSGKICKPFPFIFENIIEAFLKNNTENQDLIIVPITINYDKIYEGQKFPFELLGEEKSEETFFKTAKQILWIREQYGRVCVKYCKPMSMREKIQEYVKNQQLDPHFLDNYHLLQYQTQEYQKIRKNFSDHLSIDLVQTLSENLVTMTTQLVASILLFHRGTGISEEDLIKETSWLFTEIEARSGVMSMNVTPSITSIKSSLKHLEQFVEQKKDLFQPQAKPLKGFKNVMMLAYYRNSLVHLFVNDAYIACALEAFGETINSSEGVSLQRLWEQTQFISDILRDEFMVRDQINSFESFLTRLNFLETRKFVEVIGQGENKLVKVKKENSQGLRLICSLFQPFIESYWVTLSFLQNVDNQSNSLKQFAQKVQWLAETLFDEGYMSFNESCSYETINNAFLLLIKHGLVKSMNTMSHNKRNHQQELYTIANEPKDIEQLKNLYERLTFFKPVVTFKTSTAQYDENVRRIITSNLSVNGAKL